jgi:hypothetical protein
MNPTADQFVFCFLNTGSSMEGQKAEEVVISEHRLVEVEQQAVISTAFMEHLAAAERVQHQEILIRVRNMVRHLDGLLDDKPVG